MSATDELRRLLDERGVEYKGHYLSTSWYAGMKLYMATDDANGTLTVDNLTPEQAIAATLGSEFGSGTLTAEQVREAIKANSWPETGMLLEFSNSSWQAIADELNARAERTCRIEGTYYDELWEATCTRLSCGHDVWIEEPKFCSECGARIDVNGKPCEEIVRCRDCEHIVWTDNPMTSTHYWCIENDRPCALDGFCSLAERRENGGIESIYDWQWVRDLVGEDEAERRKEKQKAMDE